MKNKIKIGSLVNIKKFYFRNDVGGTEIMTRNVTVMVVKKWYDYETGWRFIGKLYNMTDVEAMRAAGVTRLKPEDYKSAKMIEKTLAAAEAFKTSVEVFFSEFDLQ